MKPIYALLVGIDNYPAPLPKLGGSVKDVQKIKTYLEKTFSDRPLHIKTLLNEEATYENLIQYFREHLGQAKESDVAWFHYSGHGSRQLASKEFQELNSGKKDETLVLIDSRPTGNDLADKELGVLLSEISMNKPHLMVTLDCCHSGSGTRSVDEEFIKRLSIDRPDERPFESYLQGYFKNRGTTDSPSGNYIFYAACNRFQSAKESFSGGGLFTDNFINTLSQSGKDISYNDLLIKLRQGVVKMKWDQDPQLEVIGDITGYTKFLDGSPMKDAPKFAIAKSDNDWVMEAGQIFGINEDVNLSIMEDGVDAPIAKAKVKYANAQNSVIDIEGSLADGKKYWAVPLNLPGAPFQVALQVDEKYQQEFTDQEKQFLNVSFNLTPDGSEPFEVKQNNDFFEFNDTIKKQTLLRSKVGDKASMDELVRKVNHVASWTRTFNLQNNKTNLNPGSCTINLELEMTPGNIQKYEPGQEIKFKYDGSRVPFKLWIQNNFTQPLNFALVYLSDHYGAFQRKNEPLEKSEQPTLFYGGTTDDVFYLPDGLSTSTDCFLIIISTERTDDFQLSLEEIEFADIKANFRAIPGMSQPTKVKGEWFTARYVITLERSGMSIS